LLVFVNSSDCLSGSVHYAKGASLKINVPKEVLDSVEGCEHGFTCLEKKPSCGERKMCKVLDVDGKNILFLRDRENAVCHYRLPFGDGQICRCPLHYWLKTNNHL